MDNPNPSLPLLPSSPPCSLRFLSNKHKKKTSSSCFFFCCCCSFLFVNQNQLQNSFKTKKPTPKPKPKPRQPKMQQPPPMKKNPLLCTGHSRPVPFFSYSDILEDGNFYISSSCLDGKPMLRDGKTGDWIGTFLGHKGIVFVFFFFLFFFFFFLFGSWSQIKTV